MISTEQGLEKIEGLCVYDAVVLSQIIDKLLRHGLVMGRELSHVAAVRAKISEAVQAAIGDDLDTLLATEAENTNTK